MPAEATPALLHIAGYVTGATLYAMLLVLLVRSGSADRLARATAVLGIVWNGGELLFHGARLAAWTPIAPWFAASAYAALGLLASVVVHSVSRPREDWPATHQRLASVVAAMAWTTGAVAGLLHLRAAAVGAPLPAIDGLDIMTAGLVATAIPLVIVTRRQHHWRRILWMTALAIFGVSALHLGRFHGANESWVAELIGHHASIPLAFAMLYRDYRFALADLFLKRGLTLLALVGIVLSVYALIAPVLPPVDPGALALLLVAWIATALLFPRLRQSVSGFVDRVVLARPNYASLTDDLASRLQQADSVEAARRLVCDTLAPALSAAWVRTFDASDLLPTPGTHTIDIPTAEPPRVRLVVGPLTGGRRLLSDDEAMLDRVATVLARRIDALRIIAERYDRMLREREMSALATEAELRALRAQINPHFLFNALTTIGYLIQDAPGRARETLLRLTTLLRAVLRSDGDLSTLGRERELVEAYLRIEHERFEERLTTVVDIPPHLHAVRLPSLILQALVENAIKHGVAPSRHGGHVSVTAHVQTAGGAARLSLVVANTGAPLVTARVSTGIGLQSVSRRLAHHFGEAATFRLRRDEDGRTRAEVSVPLDHGSLAEVHAPTGSDR